MGEDDGELGLVADQGEHAAGDDDLAVRQHEGVGLGRIEHLEAPVPPLQPGGVEQPSPDPPDVGGEARVAIDPAGGQRRGLGARRLGDDDGEKDRQRPPQSHGATAFPRHCPDDPLPGGHDLGDRMTSQPGG